MTIDSRPKTSTAAYERAKRSLAAGVGSAARGTLVGYKVPLFVDRADGAIVHDVDGNAYIDYLLALGPLIHGHRPPAVQDAVVAALDRLGSMVGLNNDLEAAAAELVVAAVPSVDLVRFSSTGTEAVMMALRIARVVTGRPLIVRFEGNFHGWSDVAHWSVKPALDAAGAAAAPLPVPAVRGIPPELAETMVVLPWNDLGAAELAFAEHGGRIAAVITEPLMANMGCIEAGPGYLAGLRDITRRNGALLIFDEVITGFRLALGGAQAYYGVEPDLTTMAKALGGGYPVSAVGGTAAVMSVVAEQTLPYLGTYNTNPVVMAATAATIEALKGDGVYDELHRLGNRLANGLRDEFRAAGVPATVRGHGPVFQLWFTDEPASTYRDAVGQARTAFFRAFHEAMLARGILFHPSQTEHFFMSTAHTDDLIDQTLERAKDAIREVAASAEL